MPYFLPIHRVIQDWPLDLIGLEDPTLLEKVGLVDVDIDLDTDTLSIQGTVLLAEKLEFVIPGIDVLSILIFSQDNLTTITFSAEVEVDRYVVKLVDPAILVRLSASVLKPVKRSGNSFVIDQSKSYIEIGFRATVGVSSEEGFLIENTPSLSLPPFMVGETGIIIEASDLVFALRERDMTSVPSSIPRDWRGIFVKNAKLYLPEGFSNVLPSDVQLDDFFIGSGGFCGKVTGNWNPTLNSEKTGFEEGSGAGEIFGIPFGLQSISLDFKQNTIVDSSLKGTIILPFFDGPAEVEISLTNDGDFTVTVLSEEGGELKKLTKDDLLEVSVRSMSLSFENDVFRACVGGDITPLYGDYDWPTFSVDALCIDSRGKVTLDGGWIDLNELGVVEIGDTGTVLEISKVGFGSEEDGTRWIGAYAGLKMADPIPLSGSVEGLRINWRRDDRWLTLKGAAVSFEVPDTVQFAGHLEFIEDPEEPRRPGVPKKRGFRGSGTLKVLPTNLVISAELVVGRNTESPSYPFLYLFTSCQFPVGIPLGSTGAAFYGFAGLNAIHMEPRKEAEQKWWDWYLKPTPGVADSQKWRDKRDNFALGAEVTIGTASDNGYAVNAQLLLVLVIPGPIVMLEGIAAFLQDRTKLGDAPPLRALALLDARAGEFLLNAQGQYPFDLNDEMNDIIKVTGGSEFFCNASGDWHFFLGQRTPREKRLRAEIIQLFEATSYFMLFPEKVELGFWIGYDKKWKFGPLRVKLEAWIESNVLVSWQPRQFKGNLKMVGEVGLRAFGIGASLSLRTAIQAQAPTPYRVYALIKGKLRTPRFIPDPKFEIEWEYEKEKSPPMPNPLGAVGLEHLKVSEKWPVTWNGAEADGPVVPLDAKIALSFSRSMCDAALIGTNPSGIPPRERVGNFEFEYRLVEITLEKRSKYAASSTWETVATRTVEDPETDKEKLWGVWLAVDGLAAGTEPTPNAPMTKLMLFAKSPFEYARETIDDTYYDHFGEFHPDFGWARVNPPEEVCFDFDDLPGKEKEKEFPWIRRGDVLIFGGSSDYGWGDDKKKKGFRSRQNKPLEERLVIRRASFKKLNVFSELLVGSHDKHEAQFPTLVLFPEPIRAATLTFAKAELKVHLYNGVELISSERLESLELFDVTLSGANKDNWTVLALEGSGSLLKVCYITAEEADRFDAEQKTADRASHAGDAYCFPPESELHAPNSYYILRVVTETRCRPRSGGDWTAKRFGFDFEGFYHFQTGDPPGVFEPVGEGGMAPEDQEQLYPSGGLLKDLRPYVREQGLTPAEESVAVYRAYDIGVEFNEAYVEPMYLSAGIPLSLELYDNNGEKVTASVVGAAVGASWNQNEVQERSRAVEEHLAATTRAVSAWEASLEAAGGRDAALADKKTIAFTVTPPQLDLSCSPPSTGIWVGGDDFVLKARTLYRACVQPVRPQAVFHFDRRGIEIRGSDGNLVYDQIVPTGSNLKDALSNSVGLPQPGIDVMYGNGSIVQSSQDSNLGALDLNRDLVREIATRMALEPARPPLRPVFSWNFVTSRFATFVHHLHSFIDAAWDRRALLGAAVWPPLIPDQRAQLKALVEAIPPDLDRLYQEAVKLFVVNGENLPERLEIQALDDDNGRYGFLIESPEPISWLRKGKGRVSIRVKQSMTLMSDTEPALGPAKFIDCHLDDPDWVEILVQEDIDLSGYQIQYVRPAVGGGDEFGDFYAFPAGSGMRAGTVIRIHRGIETPGSSNRERVDIYIGAGAPPLRVEGEVLVLTDAQGRSVHRRHFLPSSSFNANYTPVIAPDSDGTRAFVFLTDATDTFVDQVPDGSFHLEWTFRRKFNGMLTIQRKGSTTNEEVVLEFNVPARF